VGLAGVDAEAVAGEELADAWEEGLFGVVGESEQEEVPAEGVGVAVGEGAEGEEGADFGGGPELAVGQGAEVELFFAEAVAGEEEGLGAGVPEGEGEHAVQAGEGVFAVEGEGGKEDFRIGAGDEGAGEGGSEFLIVVDFAVEGEGVAGAGVEHGLMAGGGEVEDGESAEAHGGDGR
jgi:hypothetical protein